MKDRSLWIILALLFVGTAAGAVFDYFASRHMLAPLREAPAEAEGEATPAENDDPGETETDDTDGRAGSRGSSADGADR